MKLSEIVSDVKAQEEGERHEHPRFDGVYVTVRSIHSEAYRKRRAQLMNRVPPKRRRLGDSLVLQEEIDREALADCIVSWEGIDDEAGHPVAFSVETAREWSRDPQYRAFFEGVRELADQVGEGEPEARDESLGN